MSCHTAPHCLKLRIKQAAARAARVAFNQDSQVLKEISSTMALSHLTNSMPMRTSQ